MVKQVLPWSATITTMLLAVLVSSSAPAIAQGDHPTVSNVIPESAADTVYAEIRAIKPEAREVTLEAANGHIVTVMAETNVPLDKLKVGDTADVKYYRSVGFLVSKGSQPAQDQQTTHLPPEQAGLLAEHKQAQAPDGVSVPMTHISGMVVGLRPAEQEIDVVSPTGGGIYTISVSDPSRGALLSALKVGDVVTAVVSPPIATSIEPDRGLLSFFKFR